MRNDQNKALSLLFKPANDQVTGLTVNKSPELQQLQDFLNKIKQSPLPIEERNVRLNAFWENIKAIGTPLIEDIDGDIKNKKVTFLYRGNSDNVDSVQEQQIYLVLEHRRYCDDIELPIRAVDRLQKIPGTDIYLLSLTLPADLLVNYAFYIQPDGVNISKMIATAEENLSTADSAEQQRSDQEKYQFKKMSAQVIHDEVRINAKYPDINNPKRFIHPNLKERECYSILAMPDAPKNPYLPATQNEIKEQLQELKNKHRLLEYKVDYSKSLDVSLLYRLKKLDVIFCESTATFQLHASDWEKSNKGDNNILLIKSMADGEWGIFRQNPSLYGMPVATVSEKLAALLKNINSDLDLQQNRERINEELVSLLNERTYYVYLPKDYDKSRELPYPLLLQLDGGQYIDIAIPIILDQMIEQQQIPATIAIFSPAVGHREAEYNCNDIFIEFLTKVFVAQLQKEFNCSTDPKDIIIAGASMSGLTAFYAALKYPEIFGNVISQSGALWSNREKLTAALMQFSIKSPDSHFIMDAGKFETGLFGNAISLLEANREMQNTMQENGFADNYHYNEFAGHHSYICWQTLWPDAVKKTFDNRLKMNFISEASSNIVFTNS